MATSEYQIMEIDTPKTDKELVEFLNIMRKKGVRTVQIFPDSASKGSMRILQEKEIPEPPQSPSLRDLGQRQREAEKDAHELFSPDIGDERAHPLAQ